MTQNPAYHPSMIRHLCFNCPFTPPQSLFKLNALYDPRLLPDYGGPVFDHRLAGVERMKHCRC